MTDTQVLDKPEAKAEAPKKALAPKLQFGRMRETGHGWMTYEADIPAEIEFDTLLAPTFWTHYAGQIRPRDVIVCIREDGAWECEVRVFSVQPGEVVVKLKSRAEYHGEAPLAAAGEFAIKWRGAKQFSVMRKSDGAVIKDGLYPREKAIAFMATLVKAA